MFDAQLSSYPRLYLGPVTTQVFPAKLRIELLLSVSSTTAVVDIHYLLKKQKNMFKIYVKSKTYVQFTK